MKSSPPSGHGLPRRAGSRGIALGLGLLLGALATAASAQEAPPFLAEGQVLAHWASLSSVMVEGEVQLDRFSPEDRLEIARWLPESPLPIAVKPGAPPLACDVEIVTSAGQPDGDPVKALAGASTALLGRVEGHETGLFHGRLATLVAVKVERWLRWNGDEPPPARVLFVDSSARARIGGRTYCHRDGARTDDLLVGSRLFLATDNVLERGPFVLLPYSSQMFFETASHGVWPTGPSLPWSRFEEQLGRERLP